MGNFNEPIEEIIRGTTPTITLKINNKDFDMNSINICHVTICDDTGKNKKTFTNPTLDVDAKTISVDLTQQDTLDYAYGNINIQVKIKLDSGSVVASRIVTMTMKKILEEDIL